MALDGKVAIVTGATANTGAAISRRLSRDGAKILGIGRRQENGERIAAEVRASGGDMVFIKGDVGIKEDVQRSVDRAMELFGRVDIVVNNAASTDITGESTYRPIAEHPDEYLDRVLKVGLWGPFWYAKAVIPSMIAQGGGVFVNVSSVAAVRVHRGLVSYNISKSALDALTRSIAVEYGDHNIRANSIRVGSVSSANPGEFDMNVQSHEGERRRLRALPNPGKPEDIANMVAFLASDESAYVTGAVIPLDGGITARRGGISPAEIQLMDSPV